MPNMGTMYYPTISVTEAAEIATAIEVTFRGSITTNGLAEHLHMAVGGGGFRHKVGSLNRYQLIAGRGTLTVTSLGQRIAHPTAASERDMALREAFLKIELFQRLYERFGNARPTEGQFRIVLEEVTGAARRDVASKLAAIRRLYEDGLRVLISNEPPIITAGEGIPGPKQALEIGWEAEDPEPSAERDSQLVLTDGHSRFPVERSPRGLNLLRKYLDLLDEQLRMEADLEEQSGDDMA